MIIDHLNHRPHVGRKRLGRRTYGSGGDLWGTVVFCHCTTPGWRADVNQPMSRGGSGEAMHRWWAHVAEAVAALRAEDPALHWYRLGTRLRRTMYCEGYTADGSSCGQHAQWGLGDQRSMARVITCTVHGRLLGLRH